MTIVLAILAIAVAVMLAGWAGYCAEDSPIQALGMLFVSGVVNSFAVYMILLEVL